MPTVTVTVTDASGNVSAPASASWTVQDSTPPVTQWPLMGMSVPDFGIAVDHQPLHGGQTQIDAIRVYAFSDAIGEFNQWAPKVICLTDKNTPLGGGASSATALRNFLISFYEGSAPAARKACQIHFANGNEYGDKVSAGGGSVSQTVFADTMQRMYNVIHEETSPGVRRFPNAAMGLDPTHDQEFQGWIAGSLMPVAQWLDFVAWSDYPPGRESTPTDPTFTKPLIGSSVRANDFLDRTIRRTVAAKQAAGHDVLYEVWEVGIGDDPDDRDHRPYYTVHSLAKWIWNRCQATGLTWAVGCWWDQEVAGGNSQNVLSDEPAATSPSTAQAWLHWWTYVPELGGTKPTNWPAAPKSTWPTGA